MNNNYTGSDKITKAFIVFREKDNNTKQKEKSLPPKLLRWGLRAPSGSGLDQGWGV